MAYETSLPTPALRLLGSFQLEGATGTIGLQSPGRRILAFLALNGSTSRSVLAGSLWPDVTEDHAHGSLRTALWRLQRDIRPVVDCHDETLSLHEAVTVDVNLFTRVALGTVSAGTPHDDGSCLGLLFSGDLLPGWDDEWVIFERERLRQLRLHALEKLAIRLARRGQYTHALNTALTGMSIEPLRESVHRAIVAVHLAEHNMVEAIRHYGIYRQMMRTELGLEPSPEFTAMLPLSPSSEK